MRMRILVIGAVVMGSLLPASHSTGQSADPWVGTWKLNAAKSKYSPSMVPRSSTVTVVAVEGGFKQVVETVPSTFGLPTRSEVVARFDGKDARVRGNPNADTLTFRRIDGRSYEAISKKNGKVTITSVVSVSPDGKTRTVVQTGTDAEGRPVKNTIVYDRQ